MGQASSPCPEERASLPPRQGDTEKNQNQQALRGPRSLPCAHTFCPINHAFLHLSTFHQTGQKAPSLTIHSALRFLVRARAPHETDLE